MYYFNTNDIMLFCITRRKKSMSKLKTMRLQLGMKLREVAEKTGEKLSAVHANERRGIQTVRLAKKYASALGCQPEDVLEV